MLPMYGMKLNKIYFLLSMIHCCVVNFLYAVYINNVRSHIFAWKWNTTQIGLTQVVYYHFQNAIGPYRRFYDTNYEPKTIIFSIWQTSLLFLLQFGKEILIYDKPVCLICSIILLSFYWWKLYTRLCLWSCWNIFWKVSNGKWPWVNVNVFFPYRMLCFTVPKRQSVLYCLFYFFYDKHWKH